MREKEREEEQGTPLHQLLARRRDASPGDVITSAGPLPYQLASGIPWMITAE